MKRRVGGLGWVGLAVYVIAFDTWALRTGNETLSSAYGRALADKRRWLVTGFWLVVLTPHLHGALVPKKLHRFDPIGALADRIERA